MPGQFSVKINTKQKAAQIMTEFNGQASSLEALVQCRKLLSCARRQPHRSRSGNQEDRGNVPNPWLTPHEDMPLMFFAGIHVPQWTPCERSRMERRSLRFFEH